MLFQKRVTRTLSLNNSLYGRGKLGPSSPIYLFAPQLSFVPVLPGKWGPERTVYRKTPEVAEKISRAYKAQSFTIWRNEVWSYEEKWTNHIVCFEKKISVYFSVFEKNWKTDIFFWKLSKTNNVIGQFFLQNFKLHFFRM